MKCMLGSPVNNRCEQAPPGVFDRETILQQPVDPRERPNLCSSRRELVTGSGSQVTRKTQALWRFRLRAAVLMLLIGFGVFLIRHGASRLMGEPLSTVLLGLPVLVLLVLSSSAAPRTRHDDLSNKKLLEASQLGQYRIVKPLGAGAMGEVYLAEHRMLKRPCAIKVIHPDQAGDPRVLARFEREVRMTAQLSHWNTVEIFDYGCTDQGTFFYVMEYLPGLSLAELLDRHGPLPAERVIHLLRQTCQALREAHELGMIHRDIKPGNIFAAQRGGLYDVVKLLDFGLVKPLGENPSARLSQEGGISGTPLFMSPEQVRGHGDVDARSDIYSLGAVAYALVTGRPPFDGSNPMDVMIAHVRNLVVRPSQYQPDVPSDLECVILRCLAKNPEDRFQDVDSLEQALAECAAAGQWTQRHASLWWHANDQTPATSDGKTSRPLRQSRPSTQARLG
jgi:eukaryotic-like serine/threonine-protein kinase